MDAIELQLASEYVQFTKRIRYNTWNIARRLSRSKKDEILYPIYVLAQRMDRLLNQQQTNHSNPPTNEIESCISLNENIDDIMITDISYPS